MAKKLIPAALAGAILLLAAGTETYTAAERRHWAFQKRAEPDVPKFTSAADRAWVKNPIDAFVLARLNKAGLRPSPPASRATLIRRVYFDLTGLPPTPAEVDAFVRDTSANAWEKLIDRLLASPHYGERWAQHWLDVVRFAETDGFEYDTHRPDAWRYRDYVVRSLNNDKPYDQFVREQLAGDELNPDDPEARVASGFQRLGSLRKNAGNQEVASSRNEVLTEMTNIVGSALLGVTLGCARCHDHKFDPIRHTDYYRIQAYFAATHEKDIKVATPEEEAAWKAKKEPVEREIRELKQKMRGTKGEERDKIEKQIEDAQDKMPDAPPSLYTVANDFEKASPIHVLARGEYTNKGQKVGMRPLGVLLGDGAPELPADTRQPRAALANWVVDPFNPLTARVAVNRIWQYHFGRGIVPTPNDFGRMGNRPSHPELLDWLANRFVEGGWKMKPIHRLILMSSAYRQSSDSPRVEVASATDPDNALLWKFNRRRLDAGQIRDAVLAVSGRLNPKTGGPSVIVPVDKELVNLLYKPSQWTVAKDAAEHDRRTLYLMYKRNLRLPMLEVFDQPDMQISCARRESSTHAPQALEMMNGKFANDAAATLASRLDKDARTPAAQVDLAYRLATGRAPTLKERAIALEFLKTQPLREFALAVLNLNGFLYVD